MGTFKEYDRYDGLGMAGLVRKGDVSPAELYEEAIERIDRINPALNAVIRPLFDLAKKDIEKGLPEGPFTGVPFLLKDLVAAYAGVPLTGGSRAYQNYIPDEDCELVRRFRKAGVVIMGKTNCPEWGLLGVTEPELYGPTRNPWNLDHTPGGSSGGSAAAVASGMVPIASGGDGGGSIRIPSSCCALFGLKPTRGRNPTGPEHGAIWQGAVVEHIITRSVRDSAAMLDATCGTDVGAPYIIPVPERPYMEEIERAPGSLKIAFNTRSPVETDVHPECVKAVEKTARLLEDLGHRVEEDRPAIDGKALATSYFTMYMGEIAADIEELEPILGRKAKKSDVEALTWTFGLLGRAYSAGYFVEQLRQWGMTSRAMGRFHETYDLYLTPTTASPPVRVGELQPKSAERALLGIVNAMGGLGGKLLKLSGVMDTIAVQSLAKTPFTQLANFTGQPAMSVPLHWTDEGLPCGVQFIGRFGDEATLFRLAAQLEQAQPWFERRPPVVG